MFNVSFWPYTIWICCFGIGYIHFIHLTFTFGTACLAPECTYSDFRAIPSCSHGYFMNGTPVDNNVRSVRSELECARICARVAQCFSYNVVQESGSPNISTQLCELLASSTTSCLDLTARAKYVFKYKKLGTATTTTSTTDKWQTTATTATSTAGTTTVGTTTVGTTTTGTTTVGTTTPGTTTVGTTTVGTTTVGTTTPGTTTAGTTTADPTTVATTTADPTTVATTTAETTTAGTTTAGTTTAGTTTLGTTTRGTTTAGTTTPGTTTPGTTTAGTTTPGTTTAGTTTAETTTPGTTTAGTTTAETTTAGTTTPGTTTPGTTTPGTTTAETTTAGTTTAGTTTPGTTTAETTTPGTTTVGTTTPGTTTAETTTLGTTTAETTTPGTTTAETTTLGTTTVGTTTLGTTTLGTTTAETSTPGTTTLGTTTVGTTTPGTTTPGMTTVGTTTLGTTTPGTTTAGTTTPGTTTLGTTTVGTTTPGTTTLGTTTVGTTTPGTTTPGTTTVGTTTPGTTTPGTTTLGTTTAETNTPGTTTLGTTTVGTTTPGTTTPGTTTVGTTTVGTTTLGTTTPGTTTAGTTKAETTTPGTTSTTPASGGKENMTQVYTSNQSQASGSLSDLRAALQAGRRVALLVTDPVGRKYVIPGWDFSVTPSDVCLHLPLFVRTSAWNLLDDNAIWIYGDICASGSTTIFSTQTSGQAVNVQINWFTESCAAASSPSDCCGQQDVLTNLNDGSVYKGDFSTLLTRLTSGCSLTVIFHDLNPGQGKKPQETWDNYSVYMRQTAVTDSTQGRMAAQRLWAFSSQQKKSSQPYLDLTLSVTDSQDTNVGWSLDAHTSVQTSKKQNSKHSWLVEPCWGIVYSGGSNKQGSSTAGQSPYGTPADLVAAVRSGHRVRVTISEADQTIMAEADHVVITSQGVVIAQILSNMATEQMTFTAEGQWAWYFVHSSGHQCLFQVPISDQSIASSSCVALNSSWFTDGRQRDVMLETDTAGAVLRGSQAGLRQAVESMREPRVKVIASTEPGLERYLSVNFLELGPNSAVSACSMTILATTFGSDQLMKLDSSTLGLVMLVTSAGRVQTGQWKVGSLVKKTQSETSASVTWFVSR